MTLSRVNTRCMQFCVQDAHIRKTMNLINLKLACDYHINVVCLVAVLCIQLDEHQRISLIDMITAMQA